MRTKNSDLVTVIIHSPMIAIEGHGTVGNGSVVQVTADYAAVLVEAGHGTVLGTEAPSTVKEPDQII
jgi:hypothetical protein